MAIAKSSRWPKIGNKEKLIYYYVKKNYAKYAKVSDLNWKGGTYWTMSDGRELFYNKNLKQNGIISEDLLITNLEFSKHF